MKAADFSTEDLEPLFDENQISEMVLRIAGEIADDLGGKRPVLICILRGASVFHGALALALGRLGVEGEMDFIRARSYGKGIVSSGTVEITKDIETDLTNRHIVIVEDIADTGRTMDVVLKRLEAANPASIRLCALLVREDCGSIPDYMGAEIPPGFVVGYGIDWDERWRFLPDIRVVPGTS